MIEKISTKILDILAADVRLYAGGTAYPAGWTGVKREEAGDTPAEGYVNLFDKPYDIDGKQHRAAVYAGHHALEATDSIDFDTQSAGGRIEYRLLTLQLVICVQAATKHAARAQRNQLRRNVKVILMTQIVQTGYWYDLFMPGGSGGTTSERVLTTGTGGNAQQAAEGLAFVPVCVRYSWNPTCEG